MNENTLQKVIQNINNKTEYKSNIIESKSDETEMKDKYKINDTRKPNEMRTETFSGYKKSEVKKQLLQNILDSKIEQSCYWCAELICSGQFWDIWEIILECCMKYIHIGLPKLPIYIQKCYDTFRNFILQNDENDEISLRNQQNVRDLFTECMVVLCKAKKKLAMTTRKIEDDEDYNKLMYGNKLLATSKDYLKGVFKKADPNELVIPMNELCYHLSYESKNSYHAIYWIEWFIRYEQRCIKEKKMFMCGERSICYDDKSKYDIVWILFSIFFNEIEKRKEKNIETIKFIEKVIDSIYFLFCLRYQKSVIRKRRYLLYFCVFLLCDKLDYTENLIEDKELLDRVKMRGNLVYAEIKKSELEPDFNYLNIY